MPLWAGDDRHGRRVGGWEVLTLADDDIGKDWALPVLSPMAKSIDTGG